MSYQSVGENQPQIDPTKKKILISVLIVIAIIIVAIVIAVSTIVIKNRRPTTVLLISIDGFSNAYLSRYNESTMPNLYSLIKDGVKAEYMDPSFPTLTFPNHFTIV